MDQPDGFLVAEDLSPRSVGDVTFVPQVFVDVVVDYVLESVSQFRQVEDGVGAL